ncbi:MAG TPA: monodechloroaminopyrrolnitrin synthase PrnB family protein [Ktedonobacteraceae bacterium]|jgi:hypothetical protein|nr:monodechloroaminopyrrolnitrin synthase PrnB family protein [Ktedonobacteraceae bacterium]
MHFLNNKRIADLDPLGADVLMTKVPEFNAHGDLKNLASLLRTLCKRVDLKSRTHNDVLAIVRDIGIVAGSIRRHGECPVGLVPELEPALVKSGELTDLPPRDTLMHYTIWNPKGSRTRTYTNHDQEPNLIESMRISLPAISSATRKLVRLQSLNLQSPRTAQIAASIADDLKVFIAGLNHSKNNVAPDVFITEFRPFFEPFMVGHSALRGPGAVTMPLHIFDFILWGSSEPNEAYQQFTSDYIPYNLSEFRHYYLESRNNPTFLDRLESESDNLLGPEIQPLLSAVATWFKRLLGFRSAHLKYATKAYHGSTTHSFKNGSGGHTTGDIELIARLTDKHATRFNSLIGKDRLSC